MNRCEIWLVNLGQALGAEISKTRPAVIVNDVEFGILSLKVIVPITDWKNQYSIADWLVKLEPDANNNLVKTSAADYFQIRSVSQNRMTRKIGEINDSKMLELEVALSKVLKIRRFS